ncbi:MAG: hypothetical protein IKU27_03990 [Clostridia bacterium]|nr:hypothetical protein [Clostridia bacterium]
MKRFLALLLSLMFCLSLLAACGDKETPQTSETPDPPAAAAPEVPGTIYDTGTFCALVPEGWAAFPISDVFSETNAEDPTCFNIIKGGESDLDLFSKPYVRLDYYGPDTMMMKPSSEYYENVEEIDAMQLGSHCWNGFIGEDAYGKSAILWLEEGDLQYQAIIWLEIENEKISVDDEDVRAILASVAPSDGTTANTSADIKNNTTDHTYDWWENEWYGWWAIKNGTGVYKEPSDLNLCWDAFAEIDVYNDNTGRVTIWDTGTSRDQAMIVAYDVTYEPGDFEAGKLVSKRIDFFPYGYWNNGTKADTMSEREIGWTIDPANSTVSHFENMLEITGHYQSPDNSDDSFDYYIYLRPWGTLWEDVRSGNTEGCLYKDMMPLYHDNWYVSLLNLGYEHPTTTFDEGIDIINDYLASQNNGGSSGALDPAAKDGADGKVSMATLKEMLPWCKTETDYDMTYDEIASKFGVHGKQIDSPFENVSIYRWMAGDNDYIQISFNIHDDGSETWNVTQWQGIN